MVGKTRLALSPLLNQWWQATFCVTPRGLSTGTVLCAGGSFEVLFDFRAHRLRLFTSAGAEYGFALGPQLVAAFYHDYLALLRGAGIDVKIWPVPAEVADATPFPANHYHYHAAAAAAERFWDVLLLVAGVLRKFCSRFAGKRSPVHFFWGSFDLAVTCFSGRPASVHPGSAPNLADWATRASHNVELSSASWWPGGNDAEAALYSYAYPVPAGFAGAPVRPATAAFSAEMGKFLLPYEAVRTAPDLRIAVLDFCQNTY